MWKNMEEMYLPEDHFKHTACFIHGQHLCKVMSQLTKDKPGQLASTTTHVQHRSLSQSCKALFILLLYVFAIPQVQSVVYDNEVSCVIGQSLSKFRDCQCGEYAFILADNEVDEFRSTGMTIYTRRHGPKQRTQSYICTQCTKCGDGILIKQQCAQRSDTVCSTDECTNPTWVYDFGSKSCKPVSKREPTMQLPATREPVKQTPSTEWTPPQGTSGDNPEDGVNHLTKSSWELLNDNHDIFVGLIAIVVTFLILIFIMMILLCRILQYLKRGTISPYSSQNTSKSSINV